MSAQGMPPQLLALFAPRPPLPFIKPNALKPFRGFSDVSALVDQFETEEPPAVVHYETPRERRDRVKQQRKVAHEEALAQARTAYDPLKEEAGGNLTRDPYATLFVGSLSYDITEKKLKREFEKYGPIRKVILVRDKENKPRGYAFVEYEHEDDMKEAYKACENKKIEGRRSIVDVERARTVNDWFPRRLGGGKGPGRFAVSKKQKQREIAAALAQSAAVAAPPSSRSSFGGPRFPQSGGHFSERGPDRGSDRPAGYSREEDRGRRGGRDSWGGHGNRGREERFSSRKPGRPRSRSRERERDRENGKDRGHPTKERRRSRERSKRRESSPRRGI